MTPTPNLDLGRNPDGTYSVGEFVLCNGQSVESYTDNVSSAKIDITVPDYSDIMFERAGCYKLVERRLYMGNSGANPFAPIRISSFSDLTTNGVYFIDKTTLYQQARYNIHICDGISNDTLLEEDYGFMPNYTSLFRGNTVAILVGNKLALGDYVIIDNQTVIDNGLRVSDGANISINELTYRHPLINNDSLNSLNGSLVVKDEVFSNPLFDGVIGKCIKIGDYIYTEGKARSDGWRLVRVDAKRGVTGEFEYAPIPSQLSQMNLQNAYTIEISDYSICFEENVVGELTPEQKTARYLKLDKGYGYASISQWLAEEGKSVSPSEIERWFTVDKIDEPIIYYFTLDYNSWEINRIKMYQSDWTIRQIGSEHWATWGTKNMPDSYKDYKDAFVAFKDRADRAWEPDTSILISSGTLYSGESSPRAVLNMIRYDGKGSCIWAGDGSKDTGKPDRYTRYNFGIFTYGRKKSGKFTKQGVTVADDLGQAYYYGWTSDASFRETAVTFGFYWALSNRPWNPELGEFGKRRWDYQAVFNGEEFRDSDRSSYESTESSTMNYKGTYCGVVAGRQRTVGNGQWYSNQFSDTGTETLVTPMTIAGFSGGKPVMQSNFIIKNKSTSVPNARVYVKLK